MDFSFQKYLYQSETQMQRFVLSIFCIYFLVQSFLSVMISQNLKVNHLILSKLWKLLILGKEKMLIEGEQQQVDHLQIL
jgi:hypothetical protein